MQEMIEQVLKAEAQAQKIIQEAQEKARSIRNESEDSATAIINKARLDAQKILKDGVARVRAEAKAVYDRSITQTELDNKEFRKNYQHKIDSSVTKIIKFIITPEFKNE